jgi:lysozyme family protein
MANSALLVPLIIKWEGGLSKDRTDRAVLNPIDASVEYHTNKGIRYSTFYQWVIDTRQNLTYQDFLKMPQDIWHKIFKTLYWDEMRGDEINSQNVANMLVDFAWGSGPGSAGRAVQQVLNVEFGKGLVVDGKIGPKTLAAINSVGEKLTLPLYKKRLEFLHAIVKRDPTQKRFWDGWINRVEDVLGNQ